MRDGLSGKRAVLAISCSAADRRAANLARPRVPQLVAGLDSRGRTCATGRRLPLMLWWRGARGRGHSRSFRRRASARPCNLLGAMIPGVTGGGLGDDRRWKSERGARTTVWSNVVGSNAVMAAGFDRGFAGLVVSRTLSQPGGRFRDPGTTSPSPVLWAPPMSRAAFPVVSSRRAIPA
jgi:hypothetical protein